MYAYADDDECQRKDSCGLNAHCFNSMGSYNCMCPVGFTGDPYTKCSDIDECLTLSPCGPGAKCLNTAGGYKCNCPDKYMARGTAEMGCERAAVDVGCTNEYDCPINAHCLNSTCHCKLGYQIKGVDCVDVDECSAITPSSGQNANAKFQTIPKPFTKLGRSNQLFNNNNSTIQQQLTAICGPEAMCHNMDGSYRCECKRGYQKVDPLNPISKCRDIDECSMEPDDLSGACGMNSKCFNTEGSFKCACLDGFIPIDHEDQTRGCKSPCEGVNCGQHATCRPHGEEAACVCKAGFTYDPNNIKLGCVDINECDLNYGPAGLCGARAVCTNLPGSYKCSCPLGFTGDPTRFCEDVNECDRRFGVFGQCGEMAICNNTLGSYSCSCGPGFTGDARVKCQDIDECSSRFGPAGKCGSNAQCTNLPGKFACRCPPGFSGDPYTRCIPELAPCNSQTDCPNVNHVCQSGRCHCPFLPTSGLATTTTLTPGGATDASMLDSTTVNSFSATECVSPCERTECGPQATCRLDNELQPVCVCNAGYMAPGDGRSGCIDINECIQGMSALSGMSPLNALSVASNNNLGNNNNNNGSHPCGRNALCRNKPGTFDCVCPPNYSGNAYEACQPDSIMQQQQVMTPTTQQPMGLIKQKPANYQQEPRTSLCAEPCPRGLVCIEGQCMKASSELLACRNDLDCRNDEACEYLQQAGSLLSSYQCVHVCELHQCGPNARCLGIQHKPICQCINSTLTSTLTSLPGSNGQLVHQQHQYSGDPYDRFLGCQLSIVYTNTNTPTTTATSTLPTTPTTTTTTQSTPVSTTTTTTTSTLSTTTMAALNGPITTQQSPLTTTMPNSNVLFSKSPIQPNIAMNQMQQQQQLNAHIMDPSQVDMTTFGGPATAFEFGSPTPTYMTTPASAVTQAQTTAQQMQMQMQTTLKNQQQQQQQVDPNVQQRQPAMGATLSTSKQQQQQSMDVMQQQTTTPGLSTNHNKQQQQLTNSGDNNRNQLQQAPAMDIQGIPVTTLLPQTTAPGQPNQQFNGQTPLNPTPPTPSYGLLAPSNSNLTAQNSTDLFGLTTTTTTSSTTTIQPSSSSESVEFRTIPPSELFVMCLADGIQVELQLGGFDGIIYVKGHSQDPKCRKLVMSSSASEFVDFKVQFGHCDLLHRDGEASFVLVIQKHPKLVTYRARAYHVKCVYNTGERTVTLGFNVSMITTSGTIANTGPPPTCLMSITAVDGREVSSAEIGQDLLLRVDVQPDSIYGGFARSCEAKTMDDDGEYQYEVTDANGCATDPSIFSDWKYDTNRKSLVARFNAFKFPSSNNLRFQCNIRVCFGSCPPVNCNGIDSYGRRKREIANETATSNLKLIDGDSNTSDDQQDSDLDPEKVVVSDAFTEGALREEVMVQSNAILTFDKRMSSSNNNNQNINGNQPSAAQSRRNKQQQQQQQLQDQLKVVDDVEFVCLPRLGLLMSIVLCLLFGLLAFAIAISCWCFRKKSAQTQLRYGRSSVA